MAGNCTTKTGLNKPRGEPAGGSSEGFHALNISRNFSLPSGGLTRQPEVFCNPNYRYPPMPTRWPQGVDMISQWATIGSECAAARTALARFVLIKNRPVRFVLLSMAKHRETENRLTGYILFIDHTPSVWQKSHGLHFESAASLTG
jgi:hypothetical protein